MTRGKNSIPTSLPSRPRTHRAIRMARQFIKEHGVNWLPVDPFRFYEMNGWALFTIDEAEKIYGHPDPFGMKLKRGTSIQIDALTFYNSETGRYVTVYDHETLIERIRWTIAHEIGHIFMGHLTDFEFTQLHGRLDSKQYWVLEREANVFAAELLAPISILKRIRLCSAEDIARLCQISNDAAKNRAKDLQIHGDKAIFVESDDFYYAQFRDYLRPIARD